MGDVEQRLWAGGVQRAEAYRHFSACFYLPGAAAQEAIGIPEQLLIALDPICPPAVSHARRMKESLQEYGSQELAVEYSRLFVGPFELPAPPYGSVYLEEGRRVMGNSTVEVLKMYREARLISALREPPDHVAIELEFMHYLAYLEWKAEQSKDEAQRRLFFMKQAAFFKDFLYGWIPVFCKKILRSTENGYYISLANCLSEFIESDNKYIGSLLQKAILRSLP